LEELEFDSSQENNKIVNDSNSSFFIISYFRLNNKHTKKSLVDV